MRPRHLAQSSGIALLVIGGFLAMPGAAPSSAFTEVSADQADLHGGAATCYRYIQDNGLKGCTDAPQYGCVKSGSIYLWTVPYSGGYKPLDTPCKLDAAKKAVTQCGIYQAQARCRTGS